MHSVLEGYNGTVLAYGQTGTGKTYTMEGTLEGAHRGVIPRAAAEIFDYIQSDKPSVAADAEDSTSQWLVRVSFCQIYNEKISDLLRSDGNDLKIREGGNKEIFVEDLSETVVRSPNDIYKLIAQGRLQRNTNSTKMNATSSRSHAVFTIIVEHSSVDPDLPDVDNVTIGRLHLVDLAGSERFGVTEIEKHQKETVEINRSLSAFGKVVLALTSRGKQHIPYRDSKLTRILQTSLGGNSKTTMITTISPMSTSYLESSTTLKFANRAKSVKNVAQVNHGSDESAQLVGMQAEIRRLQAELSKQGDVSGVTSADVERELEMLKQDSAKSAMEKERIREDLMKHKRVVAAAARERKAYQDQIRQLQGKVVAGGSIQDTDVFKEAVAKERSRLQEEHAQGRSAVEEERRRLELEKKAFEEERRKFMEHSRLLSTRPVRPGLGSGSPNSPRDGKQGAPRARPLGAKHTALGPRPPGVPRRPGSVPVRPRSRAPSVEPVAGPLSPQGVGSAAAATAAAAVTAADARAQGLIDEPWRPPVSEPERESPAFSSHPSRRRAPMERPVTGSSRRLATTHDGPVSSRGGCPATPDSSGSDSDMDDMPEAAPRENRIFRRSSAPVLQRHDVDNEQMGQDRMADARDHSKTEEEMALDEYSRRLQHPSTGIPLGTRRVRLTTYKLCFSGADAVGWFMAHLEGISSPSEAVAVGQQLMDVGIFQHIKKSNSFVMSDSELYQFRRMDKDGQVMRPGSAVSQMTRRGSSTSSLSSSRGSLSRSGQWSGSRMSMTSMSSTASLTSMGSVASHRGNATSVDDYQDKNCSPLHTAAAKGDIASIRVLMQEVNVDIIDSSGRTPLMYAVISNRAKMCKFLVKHGADVNVRDDVGNTCLMWAACRGCRDSMKELLKMGADVAAADVQGRTAIHWATKLKRIDCLDFLLRCAYRVVVNQKDEENLTALHWATMCDHRDHVRALLAAQGDVTLGDGEGRTPFHYAVSRNALSCLSQLVEQCRQAINVPDKNGRTALHAACAEGSMDSAGILLSTPGVDLNATDQRLTTPLHWAAVCNRPDLCAALLDQGARMMARDSSSKTPLHYATEKGFMDCANIMQRFTDVQSHRERTSLREGNTHLDSVDGDAGGPSSPTSPSGPAPNYNRRSSIAQKKIPSRSDMLRANHSTAPPAYQR